MTSDPGALPHEGEKLSRWRLSLHDLVANSQWDRDLTEQSRDLLCTHDLQGRLLSVTPSAARLLGYSVEELLRVPMRELIPSQFRSQFDEYLQTITRDGEAHGLLDVVTRSGEQRVWDYHNKLLRTEGVTAPVVRGRAHDVTELVQAGRALRAMNKKLLDTAREQESLLRGLTLFRALLDQSNDAIEVVDPTTLRLLDVNEKECAELGYSREELLSMTVFDIAPEITQETVAQTMQELRKSGFVLIETVHRRKDGTTFPVEVNLKIVQVDKEYVVALSRDITERKLRDERLQEYERVVESLDEMIAVLNRDHCYVLANGAFLRYRGMTKDEVVGHRVTDIIPEDIYHTTIKPQLEKCFRGHVVNYEMQFTYPGIGERDLAITYLPVEGQAGIDHVACVLQDVTERKRAETGLRESEERLRLAQEIAQAGTFERNFLTGETRWTPEMEAMYGLPPGGFPRTMEQFLELVHPDDRQHVSDLLVPSEQVQPMQGEWRVIWPDGTVHWIAGRWRILKDPQGRPCRLLGMNLDVTQRKQAEAALRESEERLLLAQEAAQFGTFERNLRTGDSRWSAQMEALYGLPPGGFPKTIDKFLELIHVDDRKQVRQWIDHSLEFGEAKGEWRVLWPDGTLRWISGRWRVFKDSSGRRERAIGMDFDITERKQVEENLRHAKERLTEEKLYLEQEIDTELGFENIIGQSKALRAVMESVGKVATTDAGVLLLGETGTGKELIARAIHRRSRRAGNSFIKMNCAAIPSGLLESELFGNEKGAFTGAVSKKIGRLELADKGTIFLDEIGEISLALQPKLLRVLQDQEFERLGGTQTIKVNFRLIAATNRDLAESVRENEFRSDLYYRLNVFPIRLPSLRERREDIPLLVEHFVQKCARRMNKLITSIPRKTMDALVAWNWPGNVRELENFIERSVILSTGSVLAAPITELRPITVMGDEDDTLRAKEREHILRALRLSHGQISGPRGNATRLGLKRTTLQSKLKQLGINPRVPPQGSW